MQIWRISHLSTCSKRAKVVVVVESFHSHLTGFLSHAGWKEMEEQESREKGRGGEAKGDGAISGCYHACSPGSLWIREEGCM